MVFGRSDGDRFAVTRDLALKPGYVLQFKVCMQQGSPRAGEGMRTSHSYTQREHRLSHVLFKKGHTHTKAPQSQINEAFLSLLLRETVGWFFVFLVFFEESQKLYL